MAEKKFKCSKPYGFDLADNGVTLIENEAEQKVIGHLDHACWVALRSSTSGEGTNHKPVQEKSRLERPNSTPRVGAHTAFQV